MKINLDEFDKLHAEGYIRKQVLDGLTIWNYTHKTQHARAWNEYTTMARGLITESDGTIHSRSFPKFFNIGETPETRIENLPQETPIITAKLDGYLGLTYWHDNQVKVASRGSFQSEYARWATEWLRVHVPDCDSRFDRNFTFVFEILYPHRRIVVDNSGKYGLCLLSVIHTATGKEMDREFVYDILYRNGTTVIPIVQQYSTSTIEECAELGKTLKGTESEGFVAYYPNANLRVKIKGDDYCRIARIAMRLNKRYVWELLSGFKNGKFQPLSREEADVKLGEIADVLPPEYSKWLFDTANEIREGVLTLADRINSVAMSGEILEFDRKMKVDYLRIMFPDIWHEVLFVLDGKLQNAEHSIWKRVEPEHELPILRDGEDE